MATKGVNFRMRAVDSTKPAFDSVNRSLRTVNRETAAMRSTSRSWNKGLSDNRRSIQQLGFQMTDFSVQIAGGQSAMLAFVQQGGQMLQFFGPFGAILAAFLTVFGTLAIVFIKTGQSIETLYPALGVLRNEFSQLGAVLSWVKETMIDVAQVVVNHLDQILITATLVADYFLTKWVAGMVASSAVLGRLRVAIIAARIGFATMGTAATLSAMATSALTGALGLLRGAIARLGFPALIIAAGWLIERFMALRAGAGGFGEALGLVGDLWRAVVSDFDHLAAAATKFMGAAANTIAASFIKAFSSAGQAARNFIQFLLDLGINKIFDAAGMDIELRMPDSGLLTKGMKETADFLNKSANQMQTSGWDSMDRAVRTAEAIQAIKDALAKGDTNVNLRDLFKGGGEDEDGKGGGKKAKDKAEKTAKEVETIFQNMQKTIGSAMLGGFKALMTGAKSFADAARDMLAKIADRIIDIMMTPVFDTIAASIAGPLTRGLGMNGAAPVPSFAGGGSTGPGVRTGGVDGKGGQWAVIHSDEDIVDNHNRGGSMVSAARSGGSGGNTVNVSVTNMNKDVEVETRRSNNGDVELVVRRVMQSAILDGSLDSAQGQRFGLTPKAMGV